MSNVPIPLGWKVLIAPKVGKTMTAQGIDVSATAEAEKHLNYIGKIVDLGEAAFTACTKSGIDMSMWKARPQVGDYVIYHPYSGMQIRRAGDDDLVLLNDTDIQALIDDPDAYYSWIDVGNG